ncbi:hypothetical protein [Streptomyces antibioticus]|uniref:hypothetical protein n=1 Tax=Streptomyces antibioticus TaxID=1890 RepID=UPI0036F8A0C8
MSPEEEIRFWAQMIGDRQRTVICEPHRIDEIRAAVAERGYDSFITVRASPFCPEGKLLLLDEVAMEASQRQLFQRAGRDIRLWGW